MSFLESFRVRQWHWLFLWLFAAPVTVILVNFQFTYAKTGGSPSQTAVFEIWINCALPCFTSLFATHLVRRGLIQKARLTALFGSGISLILWESILLSTLAGDRIDDLARVVYLMLPFALTLSWSVALILWVIFVRSQPPSQ